MSASRIFYFGLKKSYHFIYSNIKWLYFNFKVVSQAAHLIKANYVIKTLIRNWLLEIYFFYFTL